MTAKRKQPTIAMSPVKNSSQVASMGYCQTTNTLAVTFKNGGTYHYHDVKPATFNELSAAKSVGSFLHTKVKGAHKHTKVEK